MKKIYKYIVDSDGYVNLPTDSKFKKLGLQMGILCLWYEIDTEFKDSLHTNRFKMFATGEEIPKGTIYYDTIFDGPFVWHVYQVLII